MFRTKVALSASLAALAAVSILAPSSTLAQEPQDPPTRVVAATTIEVPLGPEREQFISFLEEYFLPGYQLHPKVRNFRMLNHNWGSNAGTIVLVAEYDTFADIEAECGKPCDDYFAQHEEPGEGDPGYEEYQEKLGVFQKHYAKHSDEIYSTNMNRAVVEGEMQGPVGPAPPASE
ncbi:MAG: hypothetical protein ACREK5_05970 [Gemmatimonadota bacterium]